MPKKQKPIPEQVLKARRKNKPWSFIYTYDDLNPNNDWYKRKHKNKSKWP